MPVSRNSSFVGSSTEDLVLSSNTVGTLQGGGGNDVLMADFGFTDITQGGNSVGTAVNLDADPARWYTGAAHNNPFVANEDVPHTTLIVSTVAGATCHFMIAVPAGETLTLDIDAGFGRTFDGVAVPDLLATFTVDGTEVARFDDNPFPDAGSQSDYDPNGSWTNTTGATVYVFINIGAYDPATVAPFPASSAVFLANISLTGHAVLGTASMSNSVLDGGNGNDILSGGFGIDTLFGGDADDILYGGDGSDRLNGGAGADHLDGGDGYDTAIYFTAVSIDLRVSGGSGDATGDSWASIEEFELSGSSDELYAGDAAVVVDAGAGFDTVYGGGGADELHGNYGTDILNGGSGADVLFGDFDDDSLYGGAGIDTIYGGNGNDQIYGDHGQADHVYGDLGFDSLIIYPGGNTAGEVFNFAAGVWTVAGNPARNLTGIERFTDSDEASTVITAATASANGTGGFYQFSYNLEGGDDRVDLSNLGDASSVVDLGAGNDTLRVFDAQIGDGDAAYGSVGLDTVIFAAVDLTYGGVVEDVVIDLAAARISASTGSDVLAGFENVVGSRGRDTIFGDSAANTLQGHSGDDVIEGALGDDVLVGGNGDDRLSGGAGNDFLNGSAGGVDLLEGGNGDDIYVVYDSADLIFEIASGGVDTVNTYYGLTLPAHFENAAVMGTVGLTVSGNTLDNRLLGNVGDDILTGGGGNDVLNGDAGNDTLNGSAGDDSVVGGSGDDLIYGGTGVDIMRGDAGADTLRGGDGNDRLIAGADRDIIYGEAGADIFVFATGDSAATRAGADVIGDFSTAQGDRIHLAGIDANSTEASDQAFAFIGAGAFTNVAGQLRYEQVGGATFVEGDTDGDGVADFVLRLTGTHTLSAADFVL